MNERLTIRTAAIANGWSIDEYRMGGDSWRKGERGLSAMFDTLPSGGTHELVKGAAFTGGWGEGFKTATVYTTAEFLALIGA